VTRGDLAKLVIYFGWRFFGCASLSYTSTPQEDPFSLAAPYCTMGKGDEICTNIRADLYDKYGPGRG
jgi:hypothetical protein